MNGFESLPVELIAEILGELDLTSLILVSYLSRRLHAIASDPSLNPWKLSLGEGWAAAGGPRSGPGLLPGVRRFSRNNSQGSSISESRSLVQICR